MRLKTQNYQQGNAMSDPETELSKYIARRGRGRDRTTRKKWLNRKYMQKNHVAIILADTAMGDSSQFPVGMVIFRGRKGRPTFSFCFSAQNVNVSSKTHNCMSLCKIYNILSVFVQWRSLFIVRLIMHFNLYASVLVYESMILCIWIWERPDRTRESITFCL